MAVSMSYDEKAKKIIIEIDFDPKKKYPDSKSGKTFMVGSSKGNSLVEGAPKELRVGVNAYLSKKKKEE